MGKVKTVRYLIHKDYVDENKSKSGKAFCLKIYDGIVSHREWFPMSKLIFGEPNENGFEVIEIPVWILIKKGLYNHGEVTEVFEETIELDYGNEENV